MPVAAAMRHVRTGQAVEVVDGAFLVEANAAAHGKMAAGVGRIDDDQAHPRIVRQVLTSLAFALRVDANVRIEVVRKNIKHFHLTVRPPDGQARMDMETIRAFVADELRWIRQPPGQVPGAETQGVAGIGRPGEPLWVGLALLGAGCGGGDCPTFVELESSRLVLRMRSGSDRATRQAVLEA